VRHLAAVAGCVATFAMTTSLAADDSANTVASTPSAEAPAASGQPAPGRASPPDKKAVPAKPEKKVDLNNASKAELLTLTSVGEAEADKIIANRPYSSKGELVTKAGLPEGVYLSVRHHVMLRTPKKAAPRPTPSAPKS